MAAVAVAHVATAVWQGGRSPWRGVCSCGWRSVWGYANEHAARAMIDHHIEFVPTHPWSPKA